jgi:hypothetical protein
VTNLLPTISSFTTQMLPARKILKHKAPEAPSEARPTVRAEGATHPIV